MSRRLTAVLIALLATPALGSPRSDPTLGRAVFTGATVPSPTSLDLNPAALGLANSTELYFAVAAVVNRYGIDLAGYDLGTGTLTDGPDAVTEYTASPGGTFAFLLHNDTRFTIGVELLHAAPGERFVENDAFRYHTLGGYHRSVAPLTLGSSVRITSQVYFGISLALQNDLLKLRYARDTALEAGRDPARGVGSDCGGSPCGLANPQAEEQYEVDVDSGWGFSTGNIIPTLGLVIGLRKDTWLGLSYHAPPGLAIQNELTGSLGITRAPRDGGQSFESSASVFIANPPSFDGELRTRLPGDLDLHVGARLSDLHRFQAYEVRAYGSTIRSRDIPEWQPRPRGMHWTYAMWAGVEQVDRAAPLVLGARIGFETKVIDDDRTSPLTIGPASGTLDVGAQYRLADDLVVQASYGLQYFPTVNVTDSAFDPSARLRCMDQNYDYTSSACERVRYGYAIDTAAGEYSRIEQALRLAVRVDFN